jgi:FkbM family methyltransferase
MYINMKRCIIETGGLPFRGVLHIGAHEGQEAEDYVANGVKRVTWVEANPEVFEKLKNRTKNMSFEKQEFHNACVSDVEEEVVFNVANNEHSSSILKLGTHAKMYPHIKYTKSFSTKAKRIDSLFTENDMKEFDFINLDIQGAELKALKSFGDLLKTKSLRAIYTEINKDYVYENCALQTEITDYLRQFGFVLVLESTPDHPSWGDALYFRLF